MKRNYKKDRRRFLWMAAVAAFFGLQSFYAVSTNPRFQSIHMLDLMRLMIAGATLAVVIMGIAMFFARAGESAPEERTVAGK